MYSPYENLHQKIYNEKLKKILMETRMQPGRIFQLT